MRNKNCCAASVVMFFLALAFSLASVHLAGAEDDAVDWQDSPELAAVFTAHGVKGTFVLYYASEDKFIGYDRKRALTRYIPASTFKIPNSLIGLKVGAIASVDEVLPYGGRPQPVKAWEKDMSLREAIKVSNVPVYQELARRIGLSAMRAEVAALDYGNKEIGTVVDRFWLDGPLKISAAEQTLFLARLALGELPYPEAVQAKTRDIALVEKTPTFAMYAKTGLSSADKVGWWVGWLKKADHVYVFALNMDMADEDDPARRVEVGKACLRALSMI